MRLLRDCSTSYTLPQVRAKLAAAMQRELTLEQMAEIVGDGPPLVGDGPATPRRVAWLLAFRFLPGGSETRKRRNPARPKQRRLPGTE